MDLLKKIKPMQVPDTGIHAGEAYVLWAHLQLRYDTYELTQFYLNLVEDPDFKRLIEVGIKTLIKPQIEKLQDTMVYYQLTLPQPPPVRTNLPRNIETFRDEAIYRIIMSGSQSALLVHVKAINICMNDSLRSMFMDFLKDELLGYDNLIKFGKQKGWVHSPPEYRL